MGDEDSRKLIAVVEDDEQVRGILVKLLEKNDFQVKTARDGLEALQLLESVRPDLLIVDVMMPRLDGFGFVRAARFMKENKTIPVIFLTAKTDAKSMIEGINLGAKFFLGKPFQVSDVLSKIKKALNEGSMRTK